jgi:hypothetical protein
MKTKVVVVKVPAELREHVERRAVAADLDVSKYIRRLIREDMDKRCVEG